MQTITIEFPEHVQTWSVDVKEAKLVAITKRNEMNVALMFEPKSTAVIEKTN